MLRNESLAVGVNVDVGVRLFITVPFCRGVEASNDCRQHSAKSDITSNTTTSHNVRVDYLSRCFSITGKAYRKLTRVVMC